MNTGFLDVSMHRVQLPIFVALLSIVTTGVVLAADGQASPAVGSPGASVSTTLAPHDAKRPPINSDDQVVCKREDEIGSRLGGKKICMTRREWRQQSNDAGDVVNNAPRPH